MSTSGSNPKGPAHDVPIAASADDTPHSIHLSLLGAFGLTDGALPLVLPENSQRLIAFLGIRDRVVTRSAVAGALWPDASEEHANASLRSSLSRLDEAARSALRVTALDLTLASNVVVDLRDSRALAHRLVIVDTQPEQSDLSQVAIASLSSDLLPDWYDDWAQLEASQWHQLRVHALEALANKLIATGRYGDAERAALLVIAGEPLRESGYEVLIRAYLAEGNRAEAISASARFREALHDQLGLDPSPGLAALITGQSPPSANTPSIIRLARTAAAGEETREFEVVAFGISMEPSIRHGDKLLVSHDIPLSAGRIVVAVHKGTWIVKRLMSRGGSLFLCSDNADEEVAIADVDIQGVVVEFRRTV